MRKTKTKMIALALAAVMSLGTGSALAADSTLPEKVEVTFRVGDSTLSINGSNVEVETPYVEGEGTTLVPLRVITEAFGAQVDWDGETQSITLTYPDVSILLQIGNNTAKVNDHTETLPEAPALSGNGVTMVPLRFISETFGATVKYDEATQAISVVKEKKEEGSTVTGAIDKERVGDSYYDWSMDTPKTMFMEDSRFDGLETIFTDDEDNEIIISIMLRKEKDDVDTIFARMKSGLSGCTLMDEKKDKDAQGNDYFRLKAKDKENIMDIRAYIKGDKVYAITSSVSMEKGEEKQQEIEVVLDSFSMSYGMKEKTYDLSSITDGYRLFRDEKYKVSFKVPVGWMESKNENKENEFSFYPFSAAYSPSRISLGIYSKTDTVNAQALAKKDLEGNKRLTNPEFVQYTEVEAKTYGAIPAYSYTGTTKDAGIEDSVMSDVFFDMGDYVYNISVTLPPQELDKQMLTILQSIKAEELDKGKIGQILRNDKDEETYVSAEAKSWKTKVPATWTGGTGSSAESLVYLSGATGVSINCDVKTDLPKGKVSEYVSYVIKEDQDKGMQIVKNMDIGEYGGQKVYEYIMKDVNDDGVVMYICEYIFIKDGNLYDIAFFVPEIYYGEKNKEIISTIISSIEKK